MRYDRQYLPSSKQVSFVKLDIALAVAAGAWLEPVQHPVLQNRLIQQLIFQAEEVGDLRLSEHPFEQRQPPPAFFYDCRFSPYSRELRGDSNRVLVGPE